MWNNQPSLPESDPLTTVPTETPTALSDQTAAPNASELKLILFVPNEDARLDRKILPSDIKLEASAESATNRTQQKAKIATAAVQKLLQTAPEDFPAGTQLVAPAQIKGGVLELNFNEKFTDPSFWQGSARVLSSLQAITHTAVESKNQISGSEADGVRFLVDGKRIEILGELDMSDPVQIDETMVSKS